MINVGPDLANKGLRVRNKARSKLLSLMKMFFIAKPWPLIMLQTCSTHFKQRDDDRGLANKTSINQTRPSCDDLGVPS